jgi:hypothetical protein
MGQRQSLGMAPLQATAEECNLQHEGCERECSVGSTPVILVWYLEALWRIYHTVRGNTTDNYIA